MKISYWSMKFRLTILGSKILLQTQSKSHYNHLDFYASLECTVKSPWCWNFTEQCQHTISITRFCETLPDLSCVQEIIEGMSEVSFTQLPQQAITWYSMHIVYHVPLLVLETLQDMRPKKYSLQNIGISLPYPI